MKNLLVAAVLALTACTQVSSRGPRSTDVEPAPLPDDYFASQSACIDQWRELIDEWKQNGGGFKGSIVATRHQISMDYRSRMAALIRRGWERQASGVTASSIGSWPIQKDQLLASSAAFENGISIEVADECKSIAWLDPLFWDELRGGDIPEHMVTDSLGTSILKFDEVPQSMDWTTPTASHWTRYWLLQRIEPSPK